MNAEQTFTDVLYRLITSLEDTGFYAVDLSIRLSGEPHSSYEDLRSRIINHRTEMRFDISCLVSDSAWNGSGQLHDNIFLKMAGMEMEDIETLYKYFSGEEEDEETNNNFD